MVQPQGAEPRWLRPVIERLGELLRRPANRDSYGAPTISATAAEAVLAILRQTADLRTPEPQVVPTVEGGLQLEWHQRGIDLEVSPRLDGFLTVYYFDHRTGEEWEEDLRADLGRLRAALSELARRG